VIEPQRWEEDVPPDLAEGRIEARRYVEALRRDARLVLAIVAVVTIGAVVAALLRDETYRATARIALEDRPASALPQEDADTTQRNLATAQSLVTSRRVLEAASRELDGVTPNELEDAVEATVQPQANIVDVHASAPDAPGAAERANAVARAFLDIRSMSERRAAAGDRRALQREIQRLSAEVPPLGTPDPLGLAAQVDALRQQVNQLRIREASVGSDLRLVEGAAAPGSPSSPSVTLIAVLALVVSLFLAVIVVLVRDLLTPRVTGPREVGRLLGLPVLARIPTVRRRLGRGQGMLRAAEREAVESLRNAIEHAAPPERKSVTLVTSATLEEGKTTLVARLGRSLATAGHSVLLVSADLRRPALHERLGVPAEPGLGDALAAAAGSRRAVSKAALRRAAREAEPGLRGGRGRALLRVIPSGELPRDPVSLLSTELIDSLLEQIMSLDCDYVLVDSPPLLGMVDAQALAQRVDQILMVARLGTVKVDQLLDAREVLDRLEANPLGVVVVGARGEPSQYDHSRPEPPRAAGPAEPDGLLSLPGRGRAPRARPDQGRDQPEVAPVQGVDKDAVHEQAAPGRQQGR
jgi:Mrp family chromosome partitioning ATPase